MKPWMFKGTAVVVLFVLVPGYCVNYFLQESRELIAQGEVYAHFWQPESSKLVSREEFRGTTGLFTREVNFDVYQTNLAGEAHIILIESHMVRYKTRQGKVILESNTVLAPSSELIRYEEPEYLGDGQVVWRPRDTSPHVFHCVVLGFTPTLISDAALLFLGLIAWIAWNGICGKIHDWRHLKRKLSQLQ